MITLLDAMQAALIADPTLAAYLGEAVEVRQWDPDTLPDFDRYGVVLSPNDESEQPAGVLGIEKTFPVQIVCLVRIGGTLAEALAGETGPDGIGVLKFAEDVRAVLRGNSLGGAVIADSLAVSKSSRPEPVSAQLPHALAMTIEYSGRRRVEL